MGEEEEAATPSPRVLVRGEGGGEGQGASEDEVRSAADATTTIDESSDDASAIERDETPHVARPSPQPSPRSTGERESEHEHSPAQNEPTAEKPAASVGPAEGSVRDQRRTSSADAVAPPDRAYDGCRDFMTRETRLNLIFIAIILAILTPGAVILFRKKLEPTLKPMAMPHAVQAASWRTCRRWRRRREKGASSRRTPRAGSKASCASGSAIPRPRRDGRQIVRPVDHDGLPLMSDKKTFQLVAVEPLESEVRLWLMLWDRDPAKEETWSVKLADARATIPHHRHPPDRDPGARAGRVGRNGSYCAAARGGLAGTW